MNYRHSFHAGNFADLVKHALVLWLLKTRQAAGPVTVLDTHAGAGLYDLTGDATRSREAEAGVERLMVAAARPPLIEALAAEVAALNPGGGVRFYPGSPLLIARSLRPEDAYVGFELREEIAGLLRESLSRLFDGAGTRSATATTWCAPRRSRRAGSLVLIDPPFERPDDYLRAADTAGGDRRGGPGGDRGDLDAAEGHGDLRRLPASAGVGRPRRRPWWPRRGCGP